jgi:MOSC domain-containing protein YiiM
VSAKVISLNVVHAEVPDVGGSVGVTAIDKRPVADRRKVTTAGVAGDHRSDLKHHGHPNQAVYAYSSEDYQWWEKELDRELLPGVFGENLTTTGVNWNEIAVGTVIQIGTAVLQVSTPRIPCGTFQRWLVEEHWVKRFNDAGRWGSYLRVLEPGEFGAGDKIVISQTPNHIVSIKDVAQVFTGTRIAAQLTRVANCADVEEETRNKAANALANI